MVMLVYSIAPPVCTGETHDSESPEALADQAGTTVVASVNCLAVEES